MSEFNLKTGDLLLFDYEKKGGFFGFFTSMIKYFTGSKYSHIAMVVKDPCFTEKQLKGYYVWESSWEGKPDPQDGKTKLGVQITPFEEIYNTYKDDNSSIFLRRVSDNANKLLTTENLSKVHEVVYFKPYDIVPKDWIEAAFRKDDKPQKTDRFWCAALVGYIYTKCKLLDSATDWSKLAPVDFSTKRNDLVYRNDITVGEEEQIL